MKKTTILSLFMMVYTLLYTDPSQSFSKEIDQELETTVQQLIAEYKIPGVVVGVWIPGKGEWTSALGFADKKTKEKMTIDDHFRVGSVTKTFTVTGILQLVDQGKVSLDDPISKYVKDVPNGDKITLKHLANMTSGLPSYTANKSWVEEILKDRNRDWKPQELLKAAFSMPLLSQPGEKFYYCNTNTILLGLVIEKASGLSFVSYLEKNILKPLKLTNTSFPLDNKMPKPFAHGYSTQTPTNTEEDVTTMNPSWGFSAGAMISTLHDLKIWAEALGTGKLLSKKSFEERLSWLTVPPNTKAKKYGLGIGFDNGWLMHTGELPGYNSIVAYLPEQKAVFVCLINSDIAINKDTISLKIRPEEKETISLVYKDELTPITLIQKSIFNILFPKNTPE